MKRFIIAFIGVIMITGCSWKDDLQTNLFSDVWKDHTTEIMWFRSSSLLQGDAEKVFTSWAEGFEKKQSKFIRIEPTKEYTVLSQEEALQNEKNFFRLIKIVSAETVQADPDIYRNSFFRIVKEGGLVTEEGDSLRAIDIQEKNEGEYKYEKDEQFAVMNAQGVLQRFGTLSKKELKEHEERHEEDFFVSGELDGSTIIGGMNLSRNVGQYRLALEKLQSIETLQVEIATLLFKVCIKQKTIVPCY